MADCAVSVTMEEVKTPQPLSILKRIEKVNGDGNGVDYSGASFALRFYVDKEIDLHRIGFVGIDDKSPGNRFILSVEITGEFDGKNEEEVLFPRFFTQDAVINRGKGFSFGLGGAVRIPSHYFVVIKMWIYPQETNHHGKIKPVKLKTLKGVKPMSLDHDDGVTFVLGNSVSAVDELHFRCVENDETEVEQTPNEFPESGPGLSFREILVNVLYSGFFCCDIVRDFLIFNLTNNM